MKTFFALPLAAALAITLSMGASPSLARDDAALSVLQQIRSPDVKNAQLSILVGSWKGKGKVRPSRKFSEMNVKCTLNNSWILGGKLLKQTMSCKSFLMTVRRTTYLGFDKASGKIVGRSFGNFGPNNAAISGSASNGNFNLVMVHRKKNGGSVQNRLRTSMGDSNSMYSVMSKISRRPYDVMRIEYRRSGNAGNKTYL